jgi:sugar phosphate isomerase/epimerase
VRFAALLLLAGGCASSAPPAPGFELRPGVAHLGPLQPMKEAARLAAWGYAYLEPALAPVAALSDADFEALRATSAALPIRIEAMNNFVPPGLKLTGPAVDTVAVRAYVEKALGRAEALGAKLVVFGSGGARAVPDGFPRDRAWSQLKDFLKLCGDLIVERKWGMDVGIETLRRAETNILNTVAESLRLAREVKHPRIRLTVDFYHLAEENEDPAILLDAGPLVAHLHFANPAGRVFPRSPSEDARYAPFFAALAKLGYRGRLSIEANTPDLSRDGPAALIFLRDAPRP